MTVYLVVKDITFRSMKNPDIIQHEVDIEGTSLKVMEAHKICDDLKAHAEEFKYQNIIQIDYYILESNSISWSRQSLDDKDDSHENLPS